MNNSHHVMPTSATRKEKQQQLVSMMFKAYDDRGLRNCCTDQELMAIFAGDLLAAISGDKDQALWCPWDPPPLYGKHKPPSSTTLARTPNPIRRKPPSGTEKGHPIPPIIPLYR